MRDIFERLWRPGAKSASTPASGSADGAARTWRSADGLDLFARDYAPGDGPARLPVVCLHGLTRNSRDFSGLAPAMAAAGRRVLALDVRGRGRSERDPNPANYNPAVYAGDVAALMGEAGISRAIFVGTSMGGLITMTLASLRGDLVAGAVLNDIGPEIDPAGLARIGGYVGAIEPAGSWAEAAQRSRAINGPALPHLSDADWMRFAQRTWRETPSGSLVPDYDPAIAQAFASPGASAGAPDLWPLFISLAMGRPLLLIRGSRSDLLSAATADRMLTLAPQMRRRDLEGLGHAPTLDEPEARSAILDFLSDAP